MAQKVPVIVHGSWRLKLDEQKRIVFPSAIRKMLDNANEPQEIVVARNFSRSLSIYWPSLWAHTLMRATRELSGKERYAWFSIIGPSAVNITIPGSGKVTIAKELLDYADIGGELLLAGKVFFLEAWEPKRFEIDQENLAKLIKHEDIASKLMQSLPYADGIDGRESSLPSRLPNLE